MVTKGKISSPVTLREMEVLKLVAEGRTNKAIAVQLSLSIETVNRHLKNCYKKLGVHNRIGALRKAGLV